MPDPTDDRAEHAFRVAFDRHADDLEPGTLGVPPRRRRGRWSAVVGAAAAVAVVAGAVSFVALDPRQPTAATSTADTTSAAPTPSTSFEARAVSYRDVEVQVPVSWGDGPPTDAWCLVDEPVAAGPYVETDDDAMIFRTIGCGGQPVDRPGFPEYRQELWRPHLTFNTDFRTPADGRYDYQGWVLTVRTVGDVTLSLLTDAATTPLADEIVTSAQRVDYDAVGCSPRSPVQRPGRQSPGPADLAALDEVPSVAICQYTVGEPDVPGLRASRQLTGKAAKQLRDAILAGRSQSSDPDDRCWPRSGGSSALGETAIVLRFARPGASPLDVYSYYETCADAGFDDGTVLRALTADSCPRLFGERVTRAFFRGPDTSRLCASAVDP